MHWKAASEMTPSCSISPCKGLSVKRAGPNFTRQDFDRENLDKSRVEKIDFDNGELYTQIA
ncbi:hypothetical protein [Proteiniphilum sp.]|uniref:hypothetical protein n=1 Tax=Proteiniphilum sp. TaxID=1926877 RepID=UPI00332ED4CB